MNHSVSNWLRKNDLWVFFAMTFILMWPRSIWGALFSQGKVPSEPSGLLTALYFIGSPMVAALIVTGATQGRAGLKEWAGRMFRWRVGWQWILIPLLIYPIVALVAFGISELAGGQGSLSAMWQAGFKNLQDNSARIGLNPENTTQILVILLIVSFIVPIFEEGGWRAFVIPRLQERFGALNAGLIMGFIWAIWHLPAFFTVGSDQYGMPFLWFLLTIVSTSILMVWIMNNTGQSVLMTILFHGSIILTGHFLPTQLAYQTGNYVAFWLTCILLSGLAIFVSVKLARKE